MALVDEQKLKPLPKRRLKPQGSPDGPSSERKAGDESSEVPVLVVDHEAMAAPTIDMVLVNVYDLGQRHLEHWKQTGMQYSPYHAAVEVYGYEFSWGMPAEDMDVPPDVEQNEPRKCKYHRFRNSLAMGYTSVSPRCMLDIVAKMKEEWGNNTYRVHGQNCHHFSEALCAKLGIRRSLPDWLKNAALAHRGRVIVRVYDLGQTVLTRGFNAVAKSYGAFHSGVEVYGKEWSFGMVDDDVSTGISWNAPGKCELHSFREMISMGWTRFSEEEVLAIIRELEQEWKGNSYDILSKNCHNFSEALLARLGVACLPAWINQLASSFAPEQG